MHMNMDFTLLPVAESPRPKRISSAPSPSLTKFPLFPKLPPELRLMMWKHALPRAAILSMFGFTKNLPHRPFLWDTETDYNRDRSAALLRACQESRDVYTSSLPLILPLDSSYGTSEFRFSNEDIIDLANTDYKLPDVSFVTSFQNQAWTKSVENIGVGVACLCDKAMGDGNVENRDIDQFWTGAAQCFPAIKTYTITMSIWDGDSLNVGLRRILGNGDKLRKVQEVLASANRVVSDSAEAPVLRIALRGRRNQTRLIPDKLVKAYLEGRDMAEDGNDQDGWDCCTPWANAVYVIGGQNCGI